MLFIGEDFKENWLKYSKDFKILDESAIYLGPNGIGKTTTYKTIKANHPLLGFFSYDDCKERILKEKNKLKIYYLLIWQQKERIHRRKGGSQP